MRLFSVQVKAPGMVPTRSKINQPEYPPNDVKTDVSKSGTLGKK